MPIWSDFIQYSVFVLYYLQLIIENIYISTILRTIHLLFFFNLVKFYFHFVMFITIEKILGPF